MSHLIPESWFAVQVIPQHELKVAGILSYKGYQQFVPTYVSRRHWSDRVKTVTKPLFAGYVFCRMVETSVGLIGATPGVIRIVGSRGRPLPIPDREIEAVQRVIQANVNAYPCRIAFKIGQRVQVTKGPLSGITGTLVNFKNRNQLVISVDVVMKAILVDADLFTVQALNDDSQSFYQATASNVLPKEGVIRLNRRDHNRPAIEVC